MKRVWKSTAVTAFALFTVGIFVAFLFSQSMLNSRYVTGYWLGVTAQSGLTLIVSAGIAAIGGAIEGSRLKSARLNRAPHARNTWQISAKVLWPALVAALGIQVASFALLASHAATATDMPDPTLLLAFLAMILFHLLLGFNLGLRLPPAISIPSALTISYFWLGSAWAVNYFPLRYMSGLILMDCCRIYETLDPTAILTAITFNGGGAIALLLLADKKLRYSSRPKIVGTAVALILVVSVVAASASLSSRLGPVPVANRPLSQMSCASNNEAFPYTVEAVKTRSLNALVICFFNGQDPEHAFKKSLVKTWGNLVRLGMKPPRVILATNVQSTVNAVGVVATPVSTPSEVTYSLVSDMVGQPVDCGGTLAAWQKRDLNYRYVINFVLTATSTKSLDLTGFAPSLQPNEYSLFRNHLDSALAFSRGMSLSNYEFSWLKASLSAVMTCKSAVPGNS